MPADPPPPRPGVVSLLWAETRSLLALLFDFSFKRFLTPRLVRILYSLSLLAAVLSALAWMGSGFREGVMQGLFTLVTGPVAFFIYVLAARVLMEVVLAIFRIAERLEHLSPPSESKRPPPAP